MTMRAMGILWPAFLAACALEMLVFAMVDPTAQVTAWSRQGVYTAAFFVFWGVSAAACALTSLLTRVPPAEPPA